MSETVWPLISFVITGVLLIRVVVYNNVKTKKWELIYLIPATAFSTLNLIRLHGRIYALFEILFLIFIVRIIAKRKA